MKKKKLLLILIVLIILSIICLLYLIILKGKKYEDSRAYNGSDVVVDDTKIYPDNVSEFALAYNGKVSTSEFYEYLNTLIKSSIPELKNSNIQLSNAKQYFQKNKTEILEKYGISNSEKFYNFVEAVNGLSNENFTYCNSEIEKNSCTNTDDYLNLNLKVNYQNNEYLRLKVSFSNKNGQEPLIKIEVVN